MEEDNDLDVNFIYCHCILPDTRNNTSINCTVLGVCSLANASRARQFNPLNPLGVGWVPLPQTNMAAVVGRARSCVCGRARSCVRGRSCVVVRGRAWSVVRGWSCVVVPFCPLRGSTAVARTNERTTSNNPPKPPGVG